MADVTIRADVARRRFRNRKSEFIVEVDDAILDVDGHCADSGHCPDNGDYTCRPLEAALRLNPHRMADSDVAFYGEGSNGENGGGGRRLSRHSPHHTERLTEHPRVGRPERVRLQRKAENEQKKVG